MKNLLITIILISGFSSGYCQYSVASLTADCSEKTGTYDKKKLLNVARGGHGINTDLTWMPSLYDDLVEVGVDEFRIDWLLSDWLYQVVSRDNSNELQYDFSKLDQIILPLAEKGMKPVMCMAYMASALGPMEGEPNDYNEYESTIKAYVQHYKDLGYTGWAWESHNEPEGFTDLTPQQTYKMYDSFAKAVKEVDSTARVGGYASVGPDWIGYLRSFLDLYNGDASKPEMDFFSVHQYGNESWDHVSAVEREFEARSLAIPDIYITEWNNYWGQAPGEGQGGTVGGGYDTNINASYVAMKFYNILDFENVKKIYYWNFADHDPNKEFSGGSGILTVDGHRKASGNTFYFFNNLHSDIVSANISGVDPSSKAVYGIVTNDQEQKKIAMIMWNYSDKPVVMNSTLKNLPTLDGDEEFKISKLAIDSMHGNYYYDFKNSLPGALHEDAKVIDSTRSSAKYAYSRVDTLPEYSVVQVLIEPADDAIVTGADYPGSEGMNLNAYPSVLENYLTVDFMFEKKGKYELKLYDANGRFVRLLDKGIKERGKYQANYETGNLTKGLFILKLETPWKTDHVKLVKK